MAMEDMYRLVHGLLIDGCIMRPSGVENLVPYGPWTRARVEHVSLQAHYDENVYPRYSGSAVLKIADEAASSCSFFVLWVTGWTSETFYREWLAAQKAEEEAFDRRRAELTRAMSSKPGVTAQRLKNLYGPWALHVLDPIYTRTGILDRWASGETATLPHRHRYTLPEGKSLPTREEFERSVRELGLISVPEATTVAP